MQLSLPCVNAMIVFVAALAVVWAPLLSKVLSGLYDSNPWTKEQFRFVMRKLLAAEDAAVPESDLCDGIGSLPEAALDAMVEDNLLSYRRISRMPLILVSLL